MAFLNDNVHQWAQQALDKYNGGYTASDINLNACTYLYGFRDDGNEDEALAVASHYLHCRYVASKTYVVGAIVGTLAVLGYDGLVKGIDTLIKEHSSKELVHKFGKAQTSSFSVEMLQWDFQGLADGVEDFIFCWGTTALTASRKPKSQLDL